ncbi:hypothetical protein ACWDSL_06330 [Streptomyces sp. NPDC000941]
MPDADSPDFSALDGHGGDEQQALDAVREVVAWCSAQIAREHRAPVPDEDRLQELQAVRQEALADQARAETASPEEAARIAADYAARLKELNGR